MEKIWRKIIFFFLFFLFLILAPTILLYSYGIRFDFERKKFIFTGAIYLKTNQKQADVFLNGKFLKKTDPMFGSVKIQNLIPKKYLVEVKKEGCFSWKKELEVEEKKVTQAEIFLFPQKINFKIAEIEIDDFEATKKKGGIPCEKILKSLGIEENFKKDCFAQKFGEKIFLISEKNLFEFLPEKEGFEKVFENLKGWQRFNEKMLVFLSHEIWILGNFGKEFLIRETSIIKDAAFFNENYLAFLIENKLKIVETEKKGGLNVYEYEIGENFERIFINEKGKIFLIKKDEVFVSEPIR